MLLVYRYRIKSLTGLLNGQARACNFVWNFCNDTQQQALKWNKRWPSGFDLNHLTAGSSKDLALHAGMINAVCEQYAKSRRQRNRPFLRWRGRRSLGWVPLKGRDLKREGQAFHATPSGCFTPGPCPKARSRTARASPAMHAGIGS
jgi:hypothetical protein